MTNTKVYISFYHHNASSVNVFYCSAAGLTGDKVNLIL